MTAKKILPTVSMVTYFMIAFFSLLQSTAQAMIKVSYINNEKSVTLFWTATGDDGRFGRATSYDMRYSDIPVGTDTAQWWESATVYENMPVPSPSGVTDSVTIGGLDSELEYYFAIKAIDDAGNYSEISNIASTRFYSCVDVNYDDNVNLLDLLIMIRDLYYDGYNGWHDINADLTFNIFDLIYMIDYLYKGGEPPICPAT